MKKKYIIILLILSITIIIIVSSLSRYREINKISATEENYQASDEISKNSNVYVISKDSPQESKVYETSNNHYENTFTNAYTPDSIDGNANNSYETIETEKLEKRSLDNVTVEVLKDTVSRTGATVIITDNNEISFSWNKEIFKVEQKNNGIWSEVSPNRNGFDVTLGYSRDENNCFKFQLNWEEDYGKLSNGTYRIVELASDDSNAIAYSNEFEIK